MKKIKFLNGINAVFALAVVALATAFTSCEKEEFNVNIEPINAQATISPIVLAVENGVTTDVTSVATVTISPSATFTGNPTLAATTATVTASYNDMSVEVKVAVPALQAGQFASLTPTIILQKETAETKIVVDPQESTNTENKEGFEDNTTDYYYYTTGKYLNKSGNKVLEDTKVINTTDLLEIGAINSFFSTLKDTYKEEEVEIDKEIPVYAHSRTIINVAYTVVTTDYKIVKTADANTKTGEEILASMKVKNFATALGDILVDQQIPGHNHAPAGHGHGHGHGGDNAGGGIVVAD